MKKKIIIGIVAILAVLLVLYFVIPWDKQDTAEPADVKVLEVGAEAKNATIMIYMNGSDLESDDGSASEDISEMLDSGIGDNVNVIIQTMGTKEWQDYDISSDTAQTYRIDNGKLKLIRDNLGQLDSTSADTLSEFVSFCKNNYPAQRYMFIFWDHGGGPVYGFGYDQWQDEEASLTIAEMARAFSENDDVHFDIIGMDCCIMGNLETSYALEPYCDYTVLSEDFESGIGWSYTEWMKKFEQNPGIVTPLLGKSIIVDIIDENETSEDGDSACLGLYNEATVRDLFAAWKLYAYSNEDALLETNFSREHKAKGRGSKSLLDMWGQDESDVTLSDYYITDILALVENVDKDSDAAKRLMSALKACIVYCGHTKDKNELTGMSVSLPYGDSYFYEQLKNVYGQLDFDRNYIDWLGKFVSDSDYSEYYDYGDFIDKWDGWSIYEALFGGNYSNGGYSEYGYEYNEGEWNYDYDEDIWYTYENDILYLYDENTDTMYYYDEEDDVYYYYDYDKEEWYLYEE